MLLFSQRETLREREGFRLRRSSSGARRYANAMTGFQSDRLRRAGTPSQDRKLDDETKR
ncbi:hypothetical protein ACQFX9_12790 [Aliinostoc sp. HNIBRCY26]|uniref:hypothetical protein n=1 Tax=Aliinostoc sp. HNIBRCY26 TaxID=3418997 RepID=UPI003D016B90